MPPPTEKSQSTLVKLFEACRECGLPGDALAVLGDHKGLEGAIPEAEIEEVEREVREQRAYHFRTQDGETVFPPQQDFYAG